MLRKRKVYPLSREEKEEVHEFIAKQLKKEYIRPSKLSQTTPVFFVGKKNGKKHMVHVIRREYRQTLGLGLVDKNRTVGNY